MYTSSIQKTKKKYRKATEQDSSQNNPSIDSLGYKKNPTLWQSPSHCILRPLQQGFQKSFLQTFIWHLLLTQYPSITLFLNSPK